MTCTKPNFPASLDSENGYFKRYHGTHAAFGGEQKAEMVISSEEFAIEGRPAVLS